MPLRIRVRLAQLLRAGELTPVWVSGEDEEGLRDRVRAREGAKRDLRRARPEPTSFLLRHGVPAPKGTAGWSRMVVRWLDTLIFPNRATQVVAGPAERLDAELHVMATEGWLAPAI